MGNLEIPSREAAYMEEDVNSAWSNTNIDRLEELCILKPLSLDFHKKVNVVWVFGGKLSGH